MAKATPAETARAVVMTANWNVLLTARQNAGSPSRVRYACTVNTPPGR
jgi:hypothetical protein